MKIVNDSVRNFVGEFAFHEGSCTFKTGLSASSAYCLLFVPGPGKIGGCAEVTVTRLHFDLVDKFSLRLDTAQF